MPNKRDFLDEVTKGKVKSELEGRFKDAEDAREPYEVQWRLNLSWLIGRQYVAYHRIQKKLIEAPAPPWRVRLVANRILPIWRGALGRLLKTRPVPDLIPATGDENDVLTAKVGDKLIKHIWGETGLEGRKSVELYGWMLSCGSAFLMPWWDHDEGGEVNPPAGEEPKRKKSRAKTQGDEGEEEPSDREGAIKVQVISPFEVYPDPTAGSWDEVTWLFYAKAYPVDVLKERYPEHKNDIQPESNLETYQYPFDPAQAGPIGVNWRDQRPTMKDMARLKEYFELPSRKYPKGRHGVFIGPVFIEYHEELPYDHRELPLTKFDFIAYPGRIWGGSVIEQLIPLQRELNRVRSQIIEARNMTAKPKILIPVTSEISEDQWSTEPGEKIFYNPAGGKPEPWVPPPIPGYVLQEIDRNEADMMEVASQHFVSRGVNPPGVRTAAGMAMLQEADDTPFGPVLLWNENSWRIVATQIIELAKQFYTETRIVYMGLGGEAEAAEFHRESLQGRYRVRVDVGSSLPMSRAARMQFGLEMLDRGAFRNDKGQIDEPRFFQFLEMETVLDIFREDQIDIRIARTENVEMRDRLYQYSAGEYDNHPLHLQYHIRFVKELALEHPEHQAIGIVDAHIKDHELRMRELELKKAEEQLAIQSGIEEIKRAAGFGQPTQQPGQAPPEGGPGLQELQGQGGAAEGPPLTAPGGPPGPQGQPPLG